MSEVEEELKAWQAENAAHISKAVNLIAPKSKQREGCRDAVETAMIEVELLTNQDRWGYFERTKPAKKAARRLAAALRKVEVALKYTDINYALESVIREAREEAERAAKIPSGKIPRENAEKKRRAVAEAYSLMTPYNDKIDRTRFAKLAALLYGDEKENLATQCRGFLARVRKWGRK